MLLRALDIDHGHDSPGPWSQSTVKRRLDYLRASGVLFFDLDYDTALFGIEMTARLWMSVTPWKLAAVGAALAGHPETVFVGAVTGPANLTATVLCPDADALYEYLTVRIGQLRSVQAVETTPIIRTVKRAGTILSTAGR
jgi:DNA-binding Lrp family transcriptional regulator